MSDGLLGLFSTHTLTFTRDEGGGTWGTDGRWVDNAADNLQVVADGSLQPFRQGKVQVVLPEGVTKNDTKIFYTKTELRVSSQYTQTIADTTVIDGLTYECFFIQDYINLIFPVNHYAAVLILQDLLTEL